MRVLCSDHQEAAAKGLGRMNLFVAGLSYRTAPVEVRERLAVTQGALRCCGCRLKAGANLGEVVVLATCNRVEIYGVTPAVNGNVAGILRHLGDGNFDFREHMYVHEGSAAVRHLFAVASGLDSMVLGETEITGQVKQAYQQAQAFKLTGPTLNRLFQTALQTAKEVRSQTQVGRGATSVGSAAVELAEKIFDTGLSSKTVMIIGAGKMGEACVRHLTKKGTGQVLVTNRSLPRAEALAAQFTGRAVPLDQLLDAMREVDIVVTSTGSPTFILDRAGLEQVMRSRRRRPLFLIDIAVPRDVDPKVQSLEDVYLYDIDDLEKLVQANVQMREQELARCEEIIEQRTAALMARFEPAARAVFVRSIPTDVGMDCLLKGAPSYAK